MPVPFTSLPAAFAERWYRSELRLHRGGLVDWAHHAHRVMHPHQPTDFWSLNLLAAGGCEVIHARGAFRVEPGGAFLIPPRTAWRSRRLVPAEELRQAQAMLGVQPEDPASHPLAGIAAPLSLPAAPIDAGGRFLAEADRSAWSDALAPRLRLRPAAELLLLDCLAAAFAAGDLDPPTAGESGSDLVADLTALIARRCLEPAFGVADLVVAAGLSRSRLDATFRAGTGLPPGRYLRRERVRLGARLLRDGDVDSVAEAARRCGFSTQALFARHFRREFGTIPSRWRRLATGG